MENKKNNFIKGAMILSMAGILVKVIGAVYRIILNRWIGAEGMGTYQLAYPIYSVLLAISTAGIPTAISKMMAEKIAMADGKNSKKIFIVSLWMLLGIGVTFSLLLFLLAPWLAEVILKVPEATMSIRAIAPAVFFVSLSSGFRGFFQGMQDMAPSATSQILEQFFRVLAIFGLVYLLLPISVDHAAAGASFGPVVGGAISLLCLVTIYLKRKDRINLFFNESANYQEESSLSIAKKLFLFALPITLGGLIIPAMTTVDSLLIPSRLLTIPGMDLETTKILYGYLSSYAGALVNFPAVITVALSASLVPAISEAIAKKDKDTMKKNITTGTKLTLLVGLPSSVGLFVLATPICELLYNDAFAGPALQVTAFTVLFITLNQTTTGILQGMGKVYTPVIHLVVGLLIKAVLTYVLVANPDFHILGAAFASVVAYAVAASLNFLAVLRHGGITFEYKNTLIRPAAISALMGVIAFALYHGANFFLPGSLATILSMGVAVLFYGMAIMMGRVLHRDELLMFPGVSEKVVSKLESHQLFRSEQSHE